MRLTIFLAAAFLLPAATAHAKAEVHFNPALTTLKPGDPTQIRMTMRKVVGEETSTPRLVAARGATPVLRLTDLESGKFVEATGTKADARGRSTVTIALPAAGLWQPRVEIARNAVFEMEPMYLGEEPAEPAAPAATRAATTPPAEDGGGGFPWLVVVALAAAAAGLLVLARRRLGSPPPRAA